MENFNWTQFTRKIAVKSSLEAMYNAWTKPQEIEKWFLSEAIYFDLNNQPIAKNSTCSKGFKYEWRWFLYDFAETGEITEANGRDFIQFTFAEVCLVDIHLSEFEDHVVVTLTQKNIPTDDHSKQNIRLGCDAGWSFFLVNLKSVYEAAYDLRNKNEKLKGMINA